MRLAYKMMRGGTVPPDYMQMETVWANPATPTYAAKADAATKLYANGTGVIPKERARVDMGYSIRELEEMRVWDQQELTLGLGLIGTVLPGSGAQELPAPTTPQSLGPSPTAKPSPVGKPVTK